MTSGGRVSIPGKGRKVMIGSRATRAGTRAVFEIRAEQWRFVGSTAALVIVVDLVRGGMGIEPDRFGEVGEEQFGQGQRGVGDGLRVTSDQLGLHLAQVE